MSESEEIVALFKQNDTNGDGTIDEAELLGVMTGIGFSEEDCKTMFASADMNKDGVINYEEFVAWVFSNDTEEKPAAEEESAAPYMKAAFELMAKSIIEMQSVMQEEGGDLEAAMANQQAMEGQFVELLGKCFDNHDKSGSGALETEEAKVFFSNLVSESGAFMETIVTISMKKMTEAMLNGLMEAMVSEEGADQDMTDEQKAGVKMTMIAGMREGVSSGIEQAKALRVQQLEDYKANKDERDAAAFAIIDVDGTGSIGKDEFVAAFTPGNEKSDQVMSALGLDSPDP